MFQRTLRCNDERVTDADQLRTDIRVLRLIIDAALNNGSDRLVILALADILADRREQLEALERLGEHTRAA
jgi:hypothetical protein